MVPQPELPNKILRDLIYRLEAFVSGDNNASPEEFYNIIHDLNPVEQEEDNGAYSYVQLGVTIQVMERLIKEMKDVRKILKNK